MAKAAFSDARALEPLKRKTFTSAEKAAILVSKRQKASHSKRNIRPSQLVYRNYWWQLFEGPGVVYEEHEFDDGSGPDPEFDFLTVCLMGWHGEFTDATGRPTPFPKEFASVFVGEFPLSRKYFVQIGFLNVPWTGSVQIGFYGWKHVN